MKAYKIDLSMYEGKVREVISEAVQRKAFELGYSRAIGGNTPGHTFEPYLFFNVDKGMTWVGDDERDHFKKHKNTAITPDDFLALTTAKDEPTFKPFDKVLVRDRDTDEWIPALYSKKNNGYHVIIGSSSWIQCITYEGNEHLLGTTDAVK